MSGVGWGVVIASAGTIGATTGLCLRRPWTTPVRRYWLTGSLFSIFNMVGVFLLWWLPSADRFEHSRPPDERVVRNHEEVHSCLAGDVPAVAPHVFEIPTGIYVDTLRFWQSNTVHIAGLFWQRLPDPLPADIEPGVHWLGASNVQVREAFRRVLHDKSDQRYMVMAWYFEGDVRQAFAYSAFPFDSQIVWLRFRPRTFEHNVVLVPDFESYINPREGNTLNYTARPGADDFDLVSENWTIEGAYFALSRPHPEDTPHMGTDNKHLHDIELRYNIGVIRNPTSHLINFALPPLFVSVILFVVLLIAVQSGEALKEHKQYMFPPVVIVASLLFIQLLSQNTLRGHLNFTGVTYVEWFYVMSYVLCFWLLFNVTCIGFDYETAWLRSVPKLTKYLYWPVVTTAVFGWTLVVLHW